ncbi:MAG: hypothetical protein HQL36_11880, partial [Alphaproteobacteria bacterium]|nr:hypothetical protein [Alphaproteobacteria bacterium]
DVQDQVLAVKAAADLVAEFAAQAKSFAVAGTANKHLAQEAEDAAYTAYMAAQKAYDAIYAKSTTGDGATDDNAATVDVLAAGDRGGATSALVTLSGTVEAGDVYTMTFNFALKHDAGGKQTDDDAAATGTAGDGEITTLAELVEAKDVTVTYVAQSGDTLADIRDGLLASFANAKLSDVFNDYDAGTVGRRLHCRRASRDRSGQSGRRSDQADGHRRRGGVGFGRRLCLRRPRRGRQQDRRRRHQQRRGGL